MNQPIVIVGIGELGGVFAKAFLRNGMPVYPVTRRMNISNTPDKRTQDAPGAGRLLNIR